MVNDYILKALEATLSDSVCKHCGRNHIVKLKLVRAGSEEEKTADATVPRENGTIVINCDKDTCVAFQLDAHLFVIRETAAL